MGTSINRRIALKAATASLASIALAVPSLAAHSPDTELERLVDQLAVIAQQEADLWPITRAKMREAESLYPPKPETTRATRKDLNWHFLPMPTEGFHKRASHYTSFMRNELAAIKSGDQSKQDRINEIVSAIDGWIAIRDGIDAQVGLTALEEEGERLNGQFSETLDRIEAIEAKSLAGLKAKARAVALIHRDDALIEIGDTTDARLASQIATALASSDRLVA